MWSGPNTDAQTWDLFSLKLGDDGIEAVVAAGSPAGPQPKTTQRKSKIVERDQDFELLVSRLRAMRSRREFFNLG